MATKTLVTPEEYLQMSFDGPDREFVDGEIFERNVGEKPHSEIEARLVEIVYEIRKRKPLFAFPDLRLKLSESHYRIPDVALFGSEKPTENVPSIPPLVVVEIVSRDDRYTEILKKLEDYRAWGVPNIWLIDPWQKKLSRYTTDGLTAVTSLRLPEFDLEIKPTDLFD